MQTENLNVVGIYTVHDKAAERYGPLFEAVNDAVALRNFSLSMDKVPDFILPDYQLIRVGSMDKVDGQVYILEKFEDVASNVVVDEVVKHGK